MTAKRITKTVKNVKSCIEQARSDYRMLNTELNEVNYGLDFQKHLVGGKVMRAYQDERGTLMGLVIEEPEKWDWCMNGRPEKQQHLIIPVCPSPEPELNGWLYSYQCHIPIHKIRRVA